jgi:hypothetical protein
VRVLPQRRKANIVRIAAQIQRNLSIAQCD